jgi:hypothetical protein
MKLKTISAVLVGNRCFRIIGSTNTLRGQNAEFFNIIRRWYV